MVGAVLVRDGQVVGQGYHHCIGGPHAEVEALRAAGDRARGACLFVTLEPCCHTGRTSPCTDAVLAAGVARVVVSHLDPDPRVQGMGVEQLRRAGVDVEVGDGADAAVRLNWRYLTSKILGRPGVTLKWAMSWDGKIATHSGESQWISSPTARRWALELREKHDALLVGSGTVDADDPRLDRRLGKAIGPNVRVVLDRRLRTSPRARLFHVEGPVRIYTENRDADGRRRLEARGAKVVALSAVEPTLILADLHDAGVQSLLVEGGGEIHGAFVSAGTFDRVNAVLAPLLIGGSGAPGPVSGGGVAKLAAAPRLEDVRVWKKGVDRVLSGFRSGMIDALKDGIGSGRQQR